MDGGTKRSRFENETPVDFKRARYGYEPRQSTTLTQQSPNQQPQQQQQQQPNRGLNSSKVLHIRNLPPEATEQDILSLGVKFGRVENVLILKGKNQAFLEMGELEHANSLFLFYSTNQATVRGRPVFFQFSNREEITTPQGTQKQSEPNSILLVTILNCFFPITIEVLHQVFSKYGRILKIVIFQKSGLEAETGALRSLIQYTSPREATSAKVGLDGQNIYNGCCTLHIQFSSLTNLNVRYNDQKSRDFTQPYTAPPTTFTPTFGNTDPTLWTSNYLQGTAGYPYPTPYALPTTTPPVPVNPPPPPTNGPTVLIVSNLDPKTEPDHLFTLFGVYGDVLRVKILFNKPDTALIQFVNSQHCIVANDHLNNVLLFGKTLSVNFSKHQSVALPRSGTEQENKLTKDYTGSPLHRFRVANSKNYHHICPPSTILHVSNMASSTTEQDLHDLFAQHGTVTAVKFFPGRTPSDQKSKDNKMALVEMGSLGEAITALVFCHNYKLNDGPTNIRVSFTQRKINNMLGKRKERSIDRIDDDQIETTTQSITELTSNTSTNETN